MDLSSLTLNLDDLTLGDIEDLEEASGMSYDDISKHIKDGANPPLKLAKALLWVAARHQDATTTLDDIRNVKLTDLRELTIKGGGELPPTDGSA